MRAAKGADTACVHCVGPWGQAPSDPSLATACRGGAGRGGCFLHGSQGQGPAHAAAAGCRLIRTQQQGWHALPGWWRLAQGQCCRNTAHPFFVCVEPNVCYVCCDMRCRACMLHRCKSTTSHHALHILAGPWLADINMHHMRVGRALLLQEECKGGGFAAKESASRSRGLAQEAQGSGFI